MGKLLDRLFSRKPKGLIGYYGLSDWWTETFTDEERREILARCQPMGDGVGLTEGDLLESSVSCLQFLDTLAGWFQKPEHRQIGYRILEKADSLVPTSTRVLDKHFHYQAQIELYYRNRDDDPGTLDRAIDACIKQIAMAPEAIQAFVKEYGDYPEHRGYKQLAIILEKRGEYSDAIALCARAESQGWAGDWEKRVDRCQKRLKAGQ